MSFSRMTLIILMATVCVQNAVMAGDDVPGKSGGGTSVEATRDGMNPGGRFEAMKDTSFERINTKTDILRGFVTYSMPSGRERDRYGAGQYEAYILLLWGDLDGLIPMSRNYYCNWDGFVKVQESGHADVVRKIRFDDRMRDGVLNRNAPELGPGSGRDKLLPASNGSNVSWLSGVVGAMDGLLIRVDMRKPEARGTIKAGSHTISFEIRPRPGL